MNEPIHILLVDDEPRNLDALEAILANAEYRLLRAGNADDALRLLLEHDVAAIVLDIQMPSMSGFELAQIIKNTKRYRETPIVFLTAYMMDDQHVIQGYGAGAVDYITKPFNPQILRQKIGVFADLFRKTRALALLNETLEDRVKARTAELERSEAALRAAAAQKDEFLAVLAHELRNPLAPLRMGLDLLLKQPDKSDVAVRTLSVMNRQLDHMVRLIDDLLDISRLSRGLLELKRECVELGGIARSVGETFGPIAARRQQTLDVEIAQTLTVNADPTRVAQILGNLVHNATKFTPEGGAIRVEVLEKAGKAVARVIDSGIGIPPDQLERAFGMFARIQREEGPPQPGLGIGLALARRLAEMHGGALEAHSAGVGCGSTFTLTLPLADAPPVEAPPPAPVALARPPGILRVVVVEDNEDVGATLLEWLEQRGHRVWAARSGDAGVGLVQEVHPDLVLCDLGLPGMDGIEVCRRVRALPLERQPQMVALTGWGREGDRDRTRQVGFDDHLVKPVAGEELEGVLSRVSNGRS